MDSLIRFLKDKITNKSSLEDIVNIFEQMCKIPLESISAEDDMLLFETGTFSTPEGEPSFLFALVRQFPNDNEEFYQIHVEISYKSDEDNKKFNETIWDEDLGESIFDYIRTSKVFDYGKNKKYTEVKIWGDET
ncbi:hypothetical protein BMT54_02975 [Pasteurellaceae bacterium 15-036681]|nr:hypothetical protein BMT54_02975 [Pasteurellaceae bacterium 15-036681]